MIIVKMLLVKLYEFVVVPAVLEAVGLWAVKLIVKQPY